LDDASVLQSALVLAGVAMTGCTDVYAEVLRTISADVAILSWVDRVGAGWKEKPRSRE
jgi:hypothetical protein